MNWEERPYQQEAIAACDAAFAAGKTSVMLESPVGSGKTPKGWEEIIEWKGKKRGFSTTGVAIQFEHAYHHVDFAWNCRHADEERARRCDQRDFDRWEKFPKD